MHPGRITLAAAFAYALAASAANPAATAPATTRAATATAPATSAPADPVAGYESLFGDESRQVAASRDPRKQAAFAKRLYEAATSAKDEPAFQALVYAKAIEFGMAHPDGYTVAANAAQGLAVADPRRQTLANEKLLAAREAIFRVAPADTRKLAAADLLESAAVVSEQEIAANRPDEALAILTRTAGLAQNLVPARAQEMVARVRDAQTRVSIRRKADSLRDALRAKPTDTKLANEYVELCLIEADRPDEALKVAENADVPFRQYVSWAAASPEALSEADALALSDFYRSQAAKASDVGKAHAWRRVRDLCQRVLATHTKRDVEFIKADLGLRDAEKNLDSLNIIGQMGATKNLLKNLDPAKDTILGKPALEAGKLVLPNSSAVRLNVAPPEEYDVRIVFTRTAGEQGLWLHLVNGQHRFRVGLGTHNASTVFFEDLPGEWPGAKKIFSFALNQKFTAVIQVRKNTLAATIDGKEITRFRIDYAKFKHNAPEINAPVAVQTSFSCNAVIEKLELIEVTGKARLAPRK